MTEEKKVIIFISVCLVGIGAGIIFLSDKKPVSVEIDDRMAAIQVAIEDWHAEKGSPPESLEELGLPEEEIQDIIKNVFQYSVSEDGTTVTLLTLGSDAKPGGKMFHADKERVFTLRSNEEEKTDTTEPDFQDKIPESSSTTVPDAIHDGYWHSEFQRVNDAVANADQSQVVFFGDSITLRWTMLKAEGKTVWEDRFARYNPINMGNSGDITPVMLYRVTHGNLDFAAGQEPRVAVLLCGTNNYNVTQSDGGKVQWDLGIDTPPQEVADGIRAVAQEFRRHLPSTRVILLGILPVKNEAKWSKCRETNRINAGYRYPEDEVVFLDLQNHFLNSDGTLKADLFLDGTHLTPLGYKVMADELEPVIKRLIELGPIES